MTYRREGAAGPILGVPGSRLGSMDMTNNEPVDEVQTTRSLIQAIYRELKAAAAVKLRDESPSVTMTPTALVNEVYLRFAREMGEDATWENRRHFFNAAAKKMTFILMDRARKRKAVRHGGGWQRVEIDDDVAIKNLPSVDWSDLYDALERLERISSLCATVLRCRYLLQFSMNEIVEILGGPPATIDSVDRARRKGLKELQEFLAR